MCSKEEEECAFKTNEDFQDIDDEDLDYAVRSSLEKSGEIKAENESKVENKLLELDNKIKNEENFVGKNKTAFENEGGNQIGWSVDLENRNSAKVDNSLENIKTESLKNKIEFGWKIEAEFGNEIYPKKVEGEFCGEKNFKSEESEKNEPTFDNIQTEIKVDDVTKEETKKLLNSENKVTIRDEFFDEIYRVPLRNPRRKSITLSPRMLKPPGDDESASNSPGNSITSINSLASLLKEKMQMLPGQIKKKKPKDYKLRAFVGFLFITCVFLVGLAYVLYHQKVLQRAYFERIKFNKAERTLKIHDSEGGVLLEGYLGVTLNSDKVYPCLAENLRDDGSICLEWMHGARLHFKRNFLHPDVRCYNFEWNSLSDVSPTDCIGISDENVHWYGGGQTAENAWPLEKGYHEFAPFVTGRVDKHQWGNVLKRYFINSKGTAIVIDDKTPLHVSISDGTHGKQLCLKAAYDHFAFIKPQVEPGLSLNYSICMGSNTTKLHAVLREKSLWDGLKENEIAQIHSLLTEPLWHITSDFKEDFNQGVISNYTDNVVELGFLKIGHVLINEFWQKNVGDFTVDPERFPTFNETLNIIHRRGFGIVFTVQPFISTESSNFAEAVSKRLLISERFSDQRIPALTRYKSLQSAGVLDVTNNRTVPWLLEKLHEVKNRYNFDAFYLDLGTAYDLPHYYQCEKNLKNPDFYKTLFINSLQGHIKLLGVNSAVERPKAPTFVSLPPGESSWEGLRQVIPTILTYGLIGYPFLIPGAVGGDYKNPYKKSEALLPDKKLYMRWFQLATFLPVLQFRHVPNAYKDPKLIEMAKILTSLRQQTINPALKKSVDEALYHGMPLIRPLWMLEPNDPSCQIVADEFSIGDDIIVAPVLYPFETEREIYLPAGVWKDGIDSSMRKGNRWIHDYKVPEDQIAYFLRMPDDIRY